MPSCEKSAKCAVYAALYLDDNLTTEDVAAIYEKIMTLKAHG